MPYVITAEILKETRTTIKEHILCDISQTGFIHDKCGWKMYKNQNEPRDLSQNLTCYC